MTKEAKSSHSDSQAAKLVSIVETAELFHSPDGTPFASVAVGTHVETWPAKSKAMRQYLAREFYESEKTPPRAQSLQDALNVIAAKASFDGREETVFLRVAQQDGSLWIDLGNKSWQAVEVTTYGWRVADKPPIRFRRSPGMRPLPIPIKGGSVKELSQFLNLSGDEDRALVYAWLLATFRPHGPYPILNLLGEQGTAKSTASRVLRALVDPFTAPLRTAPRDERDLQIAARNSHIIALDNMGSLQPWLSDALCRLATGGGLATRELYTDADEIIFDAQRPILLNGIEDVATRGDFIERSIMVYLAQIQEGDRQEEARFWSAFEKARPRILGALLDATVSALCNTGVRLPQLPRMADFAVWAASAEQGLGFIPGTFISSYNKNRKDANGLALEASPVFSPLVALMKAQNEWEGTASDLLLELGRRSPEEISRTRSWPKTARAFSGILRRLAPNFRSIGIDVSFLPREAGTGRRLIVVKKATAGSSPPSQSSQRQPPAPVPNEVPRDNRDGCDRVPLVNSSLSHQGQGVEEDL